MPERQRTGRNISRLLAVLMGLGVAACEPGAPTVSPHYTRAAPFIGMIAADEPRAALVGEDILRAGGTAGDAAAAVGFALAVTYPAAAGIGGGGACLAFEARTNKGYAVDFMPRAAAAGGEVAVPGFLWGMGAVHSRFGRRPLGQVMAPAENLARFGTPASRALIDRLAKTGDGELSRLYATRSGEAPAIGRPLVQPELALYLGGIRSRGLGDFFVGRSGAEWMEKANALGGRIRPEDMRSLSAEWIEAPHVPIGHDDVFVFPGPALDGPVLQSLVGATWVAYEKASKADKPGLVAKAIALAAPGSSAGGVTSFVAMDRFGLAIACGLTMGRDFGLRRMLPGTGTLLGVPHGGAGDLAALMFTNLKVKKVYAAAAASGPQASGAILDTLIPSVADERTLSAAGAARRASPEARTNIGFCWSALPTDTPATCGIAADPRGFGLAIGGY